MDNQSIGSIGTVGKVVSPPPPGQEILGPSMATGESPSLTEFLKAPSVTPPYQQAQASMQTPASVSSPAPIAQTGTPGFQQIDLGDKEDMSFLQPGNIPQAPQEPEQEVQAQQAPSEDTTQASEEQGSGFLGNLIGMLGGTPDVSGEETMPQATQEPVPQVTQEPVPQVPQEPVPQVTQELQAPQAPVVPQVPQAPFVPQAPIVPQAPQAPIVPQAPVADDSLSLSFGSQGPTGFTPTPTTPYQQPVQIQQMGEYQPIQEPEPYQYQPTMTQPPMGQVQQPPMTEDDSIDFEVDSDFVPEDIEDIEDVKELDYPSIASEAMDKISRGEIFEGQPAIESWSDLLPMWAWFLIFFLLGAAFVAILYLLMSQLTPPPLPVPIPQPVPVMPIPKPEPEPKPEPSSSRKIYCLIGEDEGRRVVIRVSDASLCRKTVMLTDEEYENSL